MNNNYHSALTFDYGLKQIGVAIGNRKFETTQALPIIRARDGIPNWDEIKKLIEEWKPDVLIVGLPLNMDGSTSKMAERASKFSRRLQGRFGLPVETVDERLSSQEAKSILREQGHRGDFHRDPADSVAAQLILQTWFEKSR